MALGTETGPQGQLGKCHTCRWYLPVLPFEGTVREPGLGRAASASLSLPHFLQEDHHCPCLLP